MKRFEKKVAIVTGAAQGIGRGVAKWLAREGASVVGNDLEGSEAPGVARDIGHENGPNEALDCLADVSIRPPLVDTKCDHFLRTLEETQFRVQHICHAAARHMVDSPKAGNLAI